VVDAAAGGTAVAPGDLDSDGAIDLVVARPNAASLVLFGTASDGFEAVTLPASEGALAIALGDLDGDSLVDVALALDDGTIVYRNLGARLFAASEAAAPGEALAIAAADFTGEGRAELVVGRPRSDVEVYRRETSDYA